MQLCTELWLLQKHCFRTRTEESALLVSLVLNDVIKPHWSIAAGCQRNSSLVTVFNTSLSRVESTITYISIGWYCLKSETRSIRILVKIQFRTIAGRKCNVQMFFIVLLASVIKTASPVYFIRPAALTQSWETLAFWNSRAHPEEPLVCTQMYRVPKGQTQAE